MMRSHKIRLKLTKAQESLAWWYSKVSRNFWNLLVDIDKRNNKGEFDNILKSFNVILEPNVIKSYFRLLEHSIMIMMILS